LKSANDPQEIVMARKSARKAASRSTATAGKTDRERVVDAFMALLAAKPIEQIGLAEIATGAGVSLPELRSLFDSKVGILAAHMREVDRAVLAGSDADMADEPPRERLFDVLMRRLEVLAPHRQAVRSLRRSAMCNPGLALAVNRLSVRSQQWMLTAAGINASGPKGMVRAQGLSLLLADVMRTWIDDDDEGLARTMAALDRALARGQRLSGFLDDVCRIPACVGRLRRRRRGREEEDTAAAA
jgi:AcrR family transcriptional regulator